MRRWIDRLSFWLEILGGSRASKGGGWIGAVAMGVWWMLLFVAVFATIGRATKFIYVDF